MEYNFSKDLKFIREILGVSQSEFADQIGVEQVTISRNELGRTNPSAKILENVYIYRYFAITYEFTSARVYKIVKPKELRGLFLPYHTLDPSQAIERILEAKGLLLNEEAELQRQYEIFRRIRMGSKKNR